MKTTTYNFIFFNKITLLLLTTSFICKEIFKLYFMKLDSNTEVMHVIGQYGIGKMIPMFILPLLCEDRFTPKSNSQ